MAEMTTDDINNANQALAQANADYATALAAYQAAYKAGDCYDRKVTLWQQVSVRLVDCRLAALDLRLAMRRADDAAQRRAPRQGEFQ